MQDSSLRWLLFVLIGVLGCAKPPPDQAFDKVANAGMRSILVLQVPEIEVDVIDVGTAYLSFGLIGAAMAESDQQHKSSEFDAAIRGQAHLGQELTSALEGELKRRGFEVEVDSQRPTSDRRPDTAPLEERFDYRRIKTRADAILHVSVVRAAYVATARSRSYQPSLIIRARLLSGGGKASLYFQVIVYGAKLSSDHVYIPAPPQYAYRDFESLMANSAAATAGLKAGAPWIAATIAQQLR